MPDETARFDRRKVLKTTAIGLSAGTTLTTGATARSWSDPDGRGRGRNEDDRGRCDDCGKVEVVVEDDTHAITKVERNGDTYVYRVNKERGRVEFIGTEDEVDTNDLDDGFSTMNHDEIIERSTLDVDNEGSCSSWVYDTDYSVVLAVETGDSLDDYPSGVLEGALCAAIGAYAGGMAGAALGAIVCYSVGFFFLSHIDLSGRSLAIGAWDCHQGWLNEPSVCTGATTSYTTNHHSLVQGERIPGAHLSMGDDIGSYL